MKLHSLSSKPGSSREKYDNSQFNHLTKLDQTIKLGRMTKVDRVIKRKDWS